MTVVVVSPHLDDAVLSIGGTIRRWVESGERVVLLTVFTEGGDAYTQRRHEDHRACSILGCEPEHLGMLDAPVRVNLPLTFEGLILSSTADDDADRVARAISVALASFEPARVYFPLGVGHHVDHRIVHAAHARVDAPVSFYEERPYSLVRHMVRARLRAIAVTVDGRSVTPVAAEALSDEALEAQYVRAYVPAARRREVVDAMAAQMIREPTNATLRLTSTRSAFDGATYEIVARAMVAYESQVATLFGAKDPRQALPREDGHFTETSYARLG